MFLRGKRKGREACKSHKLPSELVIEILTRLPAKSLMRFKSVSKLWSSLICSQHFTNRCLKVSSSSLRIYMWLSFDKRHVKNVLLSSSLSPLDNTTMSSFFIDQDLIIPSMEGYSLSQVFRGLICFTNGPSAKIYNTTTRQLVVLPDIEGSNIIAEDRNKDFMYHMGHDHIHDQYKVICIVSAAIEICGRYMSEHWVLLLGGGDGSSRWRKISNPFRPHLPLIKRVTIKGSVYYLAWVCLFFPVLFSFDYRSEEISMFQEPEDNAFWYWPRLIGLIEYGGRVAVLHHAHDVMELWVMDDVEKNMWSRETFLLDPSHMHLLNGIRLRVQGTTRNGEVIFVPQNTSSTGMMIVQPQSDALYHFFLYNLENNHLRKVEIKDTSNRYLTNIWDVIIRLDDVENLLFL